MDRPHLMATAELHELVLAWYDANARELPWRAPDRTPWGVLVSEVMLQQTPVVRVLPVWREWLERWPRPSNLAAEPAGEAIRAWGRLGYPRRAVRLHAAATTIVERHRGDVPDDHQALLALPGIGGYTAAAVASFAFGRRHAVVDTNVRRVHARAVGGLAQPAASLSAAESRLAEALLPTDPARAAAWNVAAMELGALVCTARNPRCADCPLIAVCGWLRAGCPPATGPARRAQAWAGTDRQVRGRILATLRDAARPVPTAALVAAVPDADLRDPGQRDRCLHGLITDGLVEPHAGGTYALPGLATVP